MCSFSSELCVKVSCGSSSSSISSSPPTHFARAPKHLASIWWLVHKTRGMESVGMGRGKAGQAGRATRRRQLSKSISKAHKSKIQCRLALLPVSVARTNTHSVPRVLASSRPKAPATAPPAAAPPCPEIPGKAPVQPLGRAITRQVQR